MPKYSSKRKLLSRLEAKGDAVEKERAEKRRKMEIFSPALGCVLLNARRPQSFLFASARASGLRAVGRSFRRSDSDLHARAVQVCMYLGARHLRVGLVPGVEQDLTSCSP